MSNQQITLFQLNNLILQTVKSNLQGVYWIKAEIAQLKENYSGHCYLELVEKDANSGKIIAQSKATIWSYTYRILKPYFETTAGRKLSEGMNVLLAVKVDFHELYGLSLNVTDIDPSYTVGDLALKKAEIVKQLKDEGVFDMNHELELPLVIQKVAVISSENAAGYGDFLAHLDNNSYGYQYHVTLFPAFVQGDKAEESIIAALDRINNSQKRFDVVAILRGGGSQTDLSCFDSYWLAYHVAQFPLPVIAGIGHEQDSSVVDLVAYCSLKTPTAVADFIIEQTVDFESLLNSYQQQLVDSIDDILSGENSRITNILIQAPAVINEKIFQARKNIRKLTTTSITVTESNLLAYNKSIHKYYLLTNQGVKNYFLRKNLELNFIKQFLRRDISLKVDSQKKELERYAKMADLANPDKILQKGFSITLYRGKPLCDATLPANNEELETIVFNGKITSKVVK